MMLLVGKPGDGVLAACERLSARDSGAGGDGRTGRRDRLHLDRHRGQRQLDQ